MKITEKTLKETQDTTAKDEDKLMNNLFNDDFLEAILNTKHINIMHGFSNNSDIEMIERTINSSESTCESSRFEADEKDIIINNLMDSVHDIVKWLNNSKDKILTITIDQEEYIGKGISFRNNRLTEYITQDLTLVLIRNQETGFICKTAYPDISKESTTRTPTGRNLIPNLAQTRTFKKSDTEQRKSLIRSAICSMNKTPTPMDYVCADIITNAAYTEDIRATFNKDEIRLIHYEETARADLNITKDSVKLTGNHSREMITLKKTAEQSIDNRFGTKLNIQKIRELEEKQEEISEKTDKDLTKDTQFDK